MPNSQRGAALLASLCFATVLAIALGSYITVCYRSLQMSTRNLSSAHGIELAETGMEDALWALNKNDWSNGWTIAGTTASKTLSGFSYDNGITGTVTLSVTNYNGSVAGVSRVVTATGTTTLSDGTSSSRTLTSTSAQAPLFLNAVAGTTGKVKFKVAGTVDSYDSSTPDLDATTIGYSAIVSSGSTSTSSATVQLVNAQIKGYVATLSTGPSYSTSAKIVGPTTPVATKIDTTRLSTSPYQPVFDELVPSGTATVLPTGTTTIGTAGATSPKLYTTTDLTLSSTQTLTIDGPVTINVSGTITISNTASIVITANGSLDLHFSGDLILNGNGIVNQTKLPKNLILVARADNVYDTLGMATNTPFYGTIYTPNNSITITNSQAIYGSIVAKSVTFSASPTIHYDVSLRNAASRDAVVRGIVTPFAISNWRETTASNP